MQDGIIYMILITMLPFLELRASIPYGILVLKYNWLQVFFVCAIANILLAPILWLFVNYVMSLFIQIKFIKKIYDKVVIRTQLKVEHYIEKYGTIGLAIFIGIPLPGSGVYSGALGAYLLGFELKDYMIASVIGVLIAAIIVTLVTLSGNGLWLKLFAKI